MIEDRSQRLSKGNMYSVEVGKCVAWCIRRKRNGIPGECSTYALCELSRPGHAHMLSVIWLHPAEQYMLRYRVSNPSGRVRRREINHHA